MDIIEVNEVNFVPIKPQNGLIGFVNFVVNNYFYVGSVAIHTRPEGGFRLVYPRVKGIDAFHPIDRKVGSLIEAAVEIHLRDLYS